jgi:hypothetical protein
MDFRQMKLLLNRNSFKDFPFAKRSLRTSLLIQCSLKTLLIYSAERHNIYRFMFIFPDKGAAHRTIP